MPCLLWHACELVNYRLELTAQFLCCFFLCLSATSTLLGSMASMDSVSIHPRTVESCDTVGCQECPPEVAPTSRPYFRTALARSVYSKILVDEEHHVDWLEAQLHMMSEVGEGNYLAQQIHKEE